MALTNWDNYFVAMAGAAAALTGLIFVSLSISLNKIHTIPQLVDRALESLVILFTILVISSLCLVPGQSYLWLGLEILIASALTWGFVSSLDVRIYRRIDKEYKNVFLAHALLSQLAILPLYSGCLCVHAVRKRRHLLAYTRYHFLVYEKPARCLGLAHRNKQVIDLS